MFRSHLTLLARQFYRHLPFSLITLSSLIIAITAAMLIFTWVHYELTYDRQDPEADHVFILLNHEEVDGSIQTYDQTVVPLLDLLVQAPEVAAMTRIDNTQHLFWQNNTSLSREGAYADSSFFHVFRANFLEGTRLTALDGKHGIALSESLARTLFPGEKALGRFVNLGGVGEVMVTAVFEDFPANNSLHYLNFVLPYQNIVRAEDEWTDYYVRLHHPTLAAALEKRVDVAFADYFGHNKVKSMLFSLIDWRLRWNFVDGQVSGGRVVYVALFAATGVFILLMGCVNYMNIATARATRRAKEIGVRKMNGATQRALVRQFLGESIIFSLLALAGAVLLTYLLLPAFRELTRLPLTFTLSEPVVWVALLALAVATGLLAGSFPAFLLSRFRPAQVIRGQLAAGFTGTHLRLGLVVFQFVLSVVMIFGAWVVQRQTQFLLQRDAGYDRHQVVNVWLDGLPPQPEALLHEISQHPSVVNVAYGGASPMEVNGYAEVKWAGMPGNRQVYLYGASAGFNMIETLELKLAAGRTFSPSVASDSNNFVVTRRAAELLGFDNPIGQRITYTMFGEREGAIIGIIEDFHNDDIHLPMAPVIFCIGKANELSNLFVRYREGTAEAVTTHLKSSLQKVLPDAPFNYSFLDQDYETQLYREKFVGRLSQALTIVAILIAGLGLLGLTMYQSERRTREIGIRKVMGASVPSILALLSKEIVSLILVANLLAWPIAWYFMNQWLHSFAYHINMNVVAYLLSAIAAVVVALLTVSMQTIRAARTNPAHTLRYE